MFQHAHLTTIDQWRTSPITTKLLLGQQQLLPMHDLAGKCTYVLMPWPVRVSAAGKEATDDDDATSTIKQVLPLSKPVR